MKALPLESIGIRVYGDGPNTASQIKSDAPPSRYIIEHARDASSVPIADLPPLIQTHEFEPARAPVDVLVSSPNKLGIRRPGSAEIPHDATSRVHHPSRRRGGGVAACSARGAAGDAGDRIYRQLKGRGLDRVRGCVSSGPQRNRL